MTNLAVSLKYIGIMISKKNHKAIFTVSSKILIPNYKVYRYRTL